MNKKNDYPLIINTKQEYWRKPIIGKKIEDKTIFIKSKKINIFYFLIIIIAIQFIFNLYFYFIKKKNPQYKLLKNNISKSLKKFSNNTNNNYSEDKIEEIESDILLNIKKRLNFIEIMPEDQRFLNGLIRKFRPNKIVEIGVSAGGSSVLILNAIKDLPNSKLYSIDRNIYYYKNKAKKPGWFVYEKFNELLNKWTLYIGKNTAEVIESIGNNIDLVFIDTVHLTPGEMLNWLEVLPFLKDEAIVVFHDTFLMFTRKESIKNYSNNQLLCFIRGKLILPSYGNKIFSRNIGAIKLEKNQKNYYKNYFMALGSQWEYFPNETDLLILRKHYKKYYGEKIVEIFDDAVEKNKKRFINLKKNSKNFLA